MAEGDLPERRLRRHSEDEDAGAPSNIELLDLSLEIVHSWKYVGMRLGLQKDVLEDIDANNVQYPSPRQKALTMLREWHNSTPDSFSYKALSEALLQEGLFELERKYCGFQESEFGVSSDGDGGYTPIRDTTGAPSNIELLDLSLEIVHSWKYVGMRLGLQKDVLEDIDANNVQYPSPRQKALTMLREWHNSTPDSFSYKALSEALLQEGLFELERKYCGFQESEDTHAQYERKECKPSVRELNKLAKELRGCWYSLAIELGLDIDTVDNIDFNNAHPTPVRKAFRALLVWHNEFSNDATYDRLAEALTEVGRDDLARKFCFKQVNRKSEDTHAQYERKESSGVPSLVELDDLSREVVFNLASLGRYLGVDEESVKNIALDNVSFPTRNKKAFEVLRAWREMGSTSTYQQLAQALSDVNLGRLADRYCGKQSEFGVSSDSDEEFRDTSGQPSVRELTKLAQKLAGCWHSVAIELGLDANAVNNIDFNNVEYPTPVKKAFRALVVWHNEFSHDATYERLAEALTEVGRHDLARKFCFKQVNRKSEDTHAQYERKESSGVPSLVELDDLSREVVFNLESLGRYLGVDEESVKNIVLDNVSFPTPNKKAFEVLRAWREMGSTSTYQQLAQALSDVNLGRLADRYCGKQSEFGVSSDSDEEFRDTSVPPEIRARGAEASQAYRMALLEGKVQIRRTRLMLIGQDRAGKTSLKKTLQNLPFNPAEPSTDGVEVDLSKLKIEVDQVKGSNWKLVREQSAGDQCNREVARQVAQKLLANHDEVDEEMGDASLSQLPSEQTDMREETPSAPDATEGAPKGGEHIISVDQPNHSDERDVPDRREPTPAGSQMQETIPENIVSLVTTHLKDPDSVAESETNEIVLDVWDFAGQHLYYASHPFFFTPRAIYLLVYNLNKDLQDRAKPCVRQGTHDIVLDNLSNETNLDALLSWLVSVHSMRRAATKSDEDKASESPEEESPDHESPPVILVGTHADMVSHKGIKKSQILIEKKLLGKAYAKHVIGGRFAVDNTNGAGAESLKAKVKEILESEPYMKEWLPVKWFNFEKTVKSIDEGDKVHHVTQERVRELAQSKCFIQDDIQLETMLNFFHDLGVIVMHRNTVVLQSHWLIDLFKKLIIIRPYSDQGAIYREFWDKLEKEGILHQKLIDRAFRDLGPGENDTKEDMLAMMEEYGLIAKFPLITESSEKGARCYFVPAQLKTSPENLSKRKPHKGDPCVLLIHFLHGFVPHGLFPQLVSRLIQWCPKVGCTHQPNLYFNAVRCIVGNEAQFDLILLCSHRFIKVVLAVAEDFASLTPVTMGAIPKKVRTFLLGTLRDLKQKCYWLGSMEYEMGVHCSACQKCSKPCGLHFAVSCPDDDCLHCVPVGNESCPRQPLVCSKVHEGGSNGRFEVLGLKSWYNEEHPKERVFHRQTEEKEKQKQLDRSSQKGKPSDKELDKLAQKLAECWYSLAIGLGLDAEAVDNIDLNNVAYPTPVRKAFRALLVWRNKFSDDATHERLAEVLTEVGRHDLAREFCIRQVNPKIEEEENQKQLDGSSQKGSSSPKDKQKTVADRCYCCCCS